jgi:hypothetical protein
VSENTLRGDCPTGCGRAVEDGHLMCKTCWFKVPAGLRAQVWSRFRRYQRSGQLRDLQRYQQARDDAIASIP